MSNARISLGCSLAGLALVAAGQPWIAGYFACLALSAAAMEWRRA